MSNDKHDFKTLHSQSSTNGETYASKDTNINSGTYESSNASHQSVAPQFEAYYREVGQTRPKRKKNNPAIAMFAAFLTGALVIGGATYSADKANLFTGGVTDSRSASGIVANGGAGKDAGLTTASLTTSEGIANIYEQASPAVVKIENYKEAHQSGTMSDMWLRQFMGGNNGNGQSEAERNSIEGQQGNTGELVLKGAGTGFFFDKEGYILTNEHVISGASEVRVTVSGRDEPLVAKVLGTSKELDLAVLKVEKPDGGNFPALKLGDSNKTNIGDWVIAIGNPYGFDQSLTMGVLSAKERPITIQDEQGVERKFEHLLQTDASINPGNSGGPLLNEKGEVIGINTAVNAQAQGIGFAIPTTTITKVLEGLKSNTL
ncbi:trypsin-like peptidase domain-containing protein [Paenibacillus sp. GSMTC-2017]|uniref:S1C family serine protease n=1 Tax=Paenibacillus sp. GSMTC-2017 TaxID=2794350 RepID=UPI0018D9723A|nr:trypsin-like peptidase domain-containing protein [Paenibacillus sp. GSMTC-2017]MBH5320249.1 trypsin-like peptidase domain-containing protein [Paenibacillus sp. GSMTC-2017]